MTRAFGLTYASTISVLLSACSGSRTSTPTAPASGTSVPSPGPPTPMPGGALSSTISIRDLSPQPGATLSVRDCDAGNPARLCTDDWRGTFDIVIDRGLHHVVLTVRFYQADVLCGYAAATRDIVTAGQTVSFAPSTIYLSDEFGTFLQVCRLPATTTRLVATVWTDTDWGSTVTQEFAASYSLTK